MSFALGRMGAGFGRMGSLGSGVKYDPDARALFSAMTTPPSTARKAAINSLILALKAPATNIWADLDILYVMAAADSQAARLNWKSPSSYTLTPSNSPAFTTDRGFTGDGTASRLSTGWAAGTNGVKFTRDDASLWLWSITAASMTSADIGVVSTIGNSINARGASGMTGRANDNDSTARSVADGTGFFGSQRVNSTTKRLWRNGAQAGADLSVASSGISGSTTWVCGAFNTNFSTRQEAVAAWGASLTGKEAAFYSAVNTYMQAVGAA